MAPTVFSRQRLEEAGYFVYNLWIKRRILVDRDFLLN
jgi:hypothetical protein